MRSQARFFFSVLEGVFTDGSKWHFDAESQTKSKQQHTKRPTDSTSPEVAQVEAKTIQLKLKTFHQALILLFFMDVDKNARKKGQQT